VNPNPTGTGLKLNICKTNNSLNLDLAMEVLPYFRVSEKRILEVVTSIKSHVSKWEIVATKMGISSTEQDGMKNAFLL